MIRHAWAGIQNAQFVIFRILLRRCSGWWTWIPDFTCLWQAGPAWHEWSSSGSDC